MGQVSIPALQAEASSLGREQPRPHLPVMKTQTPPPLAQVVIAHAHPPRQHQKTDKTASNAAAPQLALDRMQPKAQGFQFSLDSVSCPPQRFRVIGEQGQIIHIAEVDPDAGQRAWCTTLSR